jgi:hypothetical protein
MLLIQQQPHHMFKEVIIGLLLEITMFINSLYVMMRLVN